MKSLHHSCQGESHIVTGKVCQDASYSISNDVISMAIVCDGHGGSRYFRSDVGAQLAIESIKKSVETFVHDVAKSLFVGKPFTQKLAITSEVNQPVISKDTETDKVIRQLFSSIIYDWRNNILEHANKTPLTEDEIKTLPDEYIKEFNNNEGVEKTYGCTLMCYVCTSLYWFAFHLGDGKCIAFDDEGKWIEPIPWDERCFLNKTTSLCDSNALDEFRYCYCGDGHYPIAVFLGSDGIDDSFGETENMVNFYVQILKLLAKEGEDSVTQTLRETLPNLSKIGSKDDMSVACVYDDCRLTDSIKPLILWQKQNVENDINKLNERILHLRDKITMLGQGGIKDQKQMIDYQYAEKDLTETFEKKRSFIDKWNVFSSELYGDTFTPYKDEIEISKFENSSEDTSNSADNRENTQSVET